MALYPWKPSTSQIPESSGVYMFHDSEERVIYVGKARSLRQRVPNYFTTGLHPRTVSMVQNASRVEWIMTSNEVEALQLEVSLIKQHRPRFNVRYRDDKSYPYLTVTLSEEYPRALVTRGRKKRGFRYFGPYTHAYAIRETLDMLLRVFQIRSCSQGVFDRARRANRPCLLYDIGRCSGPCVGHVSAEEHREIVEGFCNFMGGRHEDVLADLKKRMQTAAGSLEFEQAARVRDQISAVKRVIERQQMVTEKREDVDVIAFFGDELEASFQTFFVRGGRVVGRKGFIVDKVEDLSDPELLATFIEDLYAESLDLPKEVLVPLLPEDHEILESWMGLNRASKVRIRVPERGSKRRFLTTVEENAREGFSQNRLKRAADFASRSKAISDLQEYLDLPEAPLRIECFDISNLGPTEVVGSMVVFEDGLPKKSDYRKFKIKGVEGQDDVASMGEMVSRRFARYLDESSKAPERTSRFAYAPGLVVIDGGKGQLNRVVEVMSDLGVVGIPVVSLAKRLEEVFLPQEKEARIIPRGSDALYLLQRIRDEAHRFAVGYQRSRRNKRMTESVLDTMEGIGPARRTAILRHFGSVKKIAEASPSEIAEVPGISETMAQRIHETVRRTVG